MKHSRSVAGSQTGLGPGRSSFLTTRGCGLSAVAQSAAQNRGGAGTLELPFQVASDEQKSREVVFPCVRGLEPAFPGAASEHRNVGAPLVRQKALVVESVGGQRSQPLRERCEVLRLGQLALIPQALVATRQALPDAERGV